MTDAELRKFHTAMIDVWYAFKPKVVDVRTDDAYWDDVVHAFDKVVDKYKGTGAEDFALKMSVAAIKSLESVYRKAAGI